MLVAGLLFDAGVILMAAAQNFGMLIAGRVMLGVAVAFASVAVTLYNSEMAPAHMRGRLNQIFQVCSKLLHKLTFEERALKPYMRWIWQPAP